MIFIAIVLAGLSYVSFLTLWVKLPVWIRRLILRYPLFFDIVISVAMFVGFGSTLIGLIATALLDAMLVLTFSFGKDFLLPREVQRPQPGIGLNVTPIIHGRSDSRRVLVTILQSLTMVVGWAFKALSQIETARSQPEIPRWQTKAAKALPPTNNGAN